MSSSRNNHSILLSHMKGLGYPVQDGICHGYAMTAIQACMVGEMDAFNERLEFIASRTNLQLEITQTKAKLAAMPSSLTQHDQKILDVMAFFDGIAVYQGCGNEVQLHNEVHTQYQFDVMSRYAASKKIEQNGGLNASISWAGVYTDAELKDYLQFLDEAAAEMQAPVSFIFCGADHSIALFYDPVELQWYSIDANKGVIEKAAVDLVDWMKKALVLQGNMAAMTTHAIFLGNAPESSQRLQKAIQKVTPQRVEYVDSYGMTLLHCAVRMGDLKTVNEAIAAGADVNKPMLHDITPLYKAAANGHKDIVAALLASRANCDARTTRGVTPLFAAAMCNHIDIIEMLCKAGANANIESNTGASPLYVAAQFGNKEVLIKLIEACADVDAQLVDGTTAAHTAAYNNHAEIISILGEAGANLDVRDKMGGTPAYIAASKGHLNALKALTEAGVNVSCRTPLGSPLDVAILAGHIHCKRYIETQKLKNAVNQLGIFSTPKSTLHKTHARLTRHH